MRNEVRSPSRALATSVLDSSTGGLSASGRTTSLVDTSASLVVSATGKKRRGGGAVACTNGTGAPAHRDIHGSARQQPRGPSARDLAREHELENVTTHHECEDGDDREDHGAFVAHTPRI